MTVKPIPDGYHSITPYLMTKGAADAIEFYKRAFGAAELFKMDMPGGKIGHAEIRIGDSRIMLADDCGGESPFRSPQSGGSPIGLHVYVENVDAVFAQAIDAGAKAIRASAGSVLRRPDGHAGRSVRAHLVHCNSQGRSLAKRNQAACRGNVQTRRCRHLD